MSEDKKPKNRQILGIPERRSKSFFEMGMMNTMFKEKQKFEQPDFFLAEIPIKDESFNDQRLWVYCRSTLSLIEFVYINNLKDYEFEPTQKYFSYVNINGEEECWLAVYVQDNCDITGVDSFDNLSRAWLYFRNYVKWEDEKI